MSRVGASPPSHMTVSMISTMIAGRIRRTVAGDPPLAATYPPSGGFFV